MALSYRIDECVRGLDVTEGGVQRQTEADGVVQARLKANWSGKNHVPGGTIVAAYHDSTNHTRSVGVN